MLFLWRALCIFSMATAVHAQAPQDHTSYAQLQQKSVHNAYQRRESITDMLSLHDIRSLELDIHVGKRGHAQKPGDWFVYHTNSDSQSSVPRLSDGLAIVRAFHDRHPQHEVITLWIDIKGDFEGSGHRPADLDQLFVSQLGDALLSPGELREACPSARDLRDVVEIPGCTWPTFAELRGRIMIVLTAQSLLDYVGQGDSALSRRAFIAPSIKTIEDVDSLRYALFFNLPQKQVKSTDIAPQIFARTLISRSWGLNDAKAWKSTADRRVHHLATDKVNVSKDQWATTRQDDEGLFASMAEDLW